MYTIRVLTFQVEEADNLKFEEVVGQSQEQRPEENNLYNYILNISCHT